VSERFHLAPLALNAQQKGLRRAAIVYDYGRDLEGRPGELRPTLLAIADEMIE
jgi:hypothetical protein